VYTTVLPRWIGRGRSESCRDCVRVGQICCGGRGGFHCAARRWAGKSGKRSNGLARRAEAGGAVAGGRRHAQGPPDRLDAEAAAVLVNEAAQFVPSASSSVAKTHRRSLEDLVRAAQLVDLRAQRLDLLALLAGRQIRPQTLIGRDLTRVLAQRLRRQPEIARHARSGAETQTRDNAHATDVPEAAAPFSPGDAVLSEAPRMTVGTTALARRPTVARSSPVSRATRSAAPPLVTSGGIATGGSRRRRRPRIRAPPP
jgi:hypothetical protein